MPALLMTTSIRSNASKAVAMTETAPALVLMSDVLATAAPPAAVMKSTTSSATGGSCSVPGRIRLLTTTFAPRCASSSAYARPSPRPAPVTTATCPSKRISSMSLSWLPSACRRAASATDSFCDA
jgi:Tfp pilus assembly protein FimV